MKLSQTKDLARIVADRTDFYMYNVLTVLDALSDVVTEVLQTAYEDGTAEVKIVPGIIIGAKKIPAKKTRNVYANVMVDTPEHINPYVRFTYNYKQRMNNIGEEREFIENDIEAELEEED